MSMTGYLLRVTVNELQDYLQNSSLLEERMDRVNDPAILDIGKAWEGILYILTGHGLSNIDGAKPPLKWAIFGAYLLDEEQDMGYGPAEYCTESQVMEISKALEEIADEKFRQMFDDSNIKMREDIYPGVLWSDGEEAFQYYFEYFKQIRAFYYLAHKNNEAVISFIG